MIFGELLTSGNYNKSEKKITGGKNGYGAKLTNIFSTYFRVETIDHHRKLKYIQEYHNNMDVKGEPEITEYKNTPYTKIQHFKKYTQDMGRLKDEMDDVDRDQIQDHDSDYELPNEFRQNWNTVSHKYDSDSKKIVKSKKKALDEINPKKKDHKYSFTNDEVNPNHFFKNVTDVVERIKTFEVFGSDLGYDPQTPKRNVSLDPTRFEGEEEVEYNGCGCCDECTGESDCYCCDECTCERDSDFDKF